MLVAHGSKMKLAQFAFQGGLLFAAPPVPCFFTGAPRVRLRTEPALARPVRTTCRARSNGVVVVAGKFDAFHRGHRELARRAAELGAPTLLSFAGMVEALGWPPRASVVAPVERPNVLRAWSAQVGRPVAYKLIPFERVRQLSPRDFLLFVRDELHATAVVCGPDWRFGHKAAGDVAQLEALAHEIGDLNVCIVPPVTLDDAPDDVVSSTSVRQAIAGGDVELAARMMDRQHRLVGFLSSVESGNVKCSEFVNQIPGDGTYRVLVRVLGRAEPIRTFARIQRPESLDPMLPPSAILDSPNAITVTIDDAESVYCDDCEIYIDFIDRVR